MKQRDEYRSGITTASANERLNVDLIEGVLDSIFPAGNKSKVQDAYSDFLGELTQMKVNTVRQLEDLLRKHEKTALAEEAKVVKLLKSKGIGHKRYQIQKARISQGVFYTHIGLARVALGHEFGDTWRKLMVKSRI